MIMHVSTTLQGQKVTTRPVEIISDDSSRERNFKKTGKKKWVGGLIYRQTRIA